MVSWCDVVRQATSYPAVGYTGDAICRRELLLAF